MFQDKPAVSIIRLNFVAIKSNRKMTNVSFSINKSNVLNEVAKTTAYSGAKMVGDEGAYERIFATASDKEMLERFWTECQISVCETLKKFLSAEETTEEGWNLVLELSQSYDASLTSSIQKELISYFVAGIVSRWYTFTNKNEAGDYGELASKLLVGIHKKVLFKKKPIRPSYS